MAWLNSMNSFLMRRVQRYILGTPWNTAYRNINIESKSVLDVGCGDGVAIGMLSKKL